MGLYPPPNMDRNRGLLCSIARETSREYFVEAQRGRLVDAVGAIPYGPGMAPLTRAIGLRIIRPALS